MEPSELMRLAIEKSRQGIAAGQSLFGCAIARDGRLLASAHNTVLQSTDVTAHAEMNAVRAGCLAVNDIFLVGAVVATTCMPCPMRLAALHWARVDSIYYGTIYYLLRHIDCGRRRGRFQRAFHAGGRAGSPGRQPRKAGARLAGRRMSAIIQRVGRQSNASCLLTNPSPQPPAPTW